MKKIDKVSIIIGLLFLGFVGFIFINLDMQMNLENCQFGTHHVNFSWRCITYQEMQKILDCPNFYLRDGYWWECSQIAPFEQFVDDCLHYGGSIENDIQLCTLQNGWQIFFVDWEPNSSDFLFELMLEKGGN